MRIPRATWFIIIVVVLLTLAVKPLREQTKLPFIANSLLAPDPVGSGSSYLDALRERAPEFVKQRHPGDPEMLRAAGLLTNDKKTGLELLKQAAEKGNAPAAWAAYAAAGLEQLPAWGRLGEGGVDPSNPESVAEEMERLRESKLPDRLDPKAAAPVLAALADWEKADPDNGLPLALKTRLLYGLHEDRKAQESWEAAASRPKVSGYWSEHTRAIARLFSQMGVPEAEVLFAASGYAQLGVSFAELRQGARIAQYEGKLAQMQGRNADAIRWWNSSIALGRNLQNTSDTIIGMLVGVALEGIGASPTWKWYPDVLTGASGGPLYKGRIWYGRDHAFYVSQVGEEKDREVRDGLVRAKARSVLLRGDSEAAMDRFMSGLMRGLVLVMFGAGAAVFAALCLLLFFALGTWRRAIADGATRLRPVCQFILALAPFAPLALAGVLAIGMPTRKAPQPIPDLIALISLAVALLTPIFLPLLAAAFTRAPGARLGTAWRGNLRRTLPDTAAIAMLCFLALNLAAIKPRAEWVRQWSDPKMTEMAQLRQRLGEKWENPAIPKDAWRAEYPQLKER